MRSSTLRLFGPVLTILLASCGGGGGGGVPTMPSTPTPVPVANVAGNWSGTYTITSCGQSDAFTDANFCGTLGNAPLPMTLVLTQAGSTVSGTLAQGTIATPVTGTVDASSHLFISGSTVYSGTMLVETVGWNTAVTGSTMSGSWNTKWSISGGGSAQTVNTLGSVAKASQGDGAVIRLTRQPISTPRDVLDALRTQ